MFHKVSKITGGDRRISEPSTVFQPLEVWGVNFFAAMKLTELYG